jgi:hypothetical protein
MSREEDIRKVAEEVEEFASEYISSMKPQILLLGPPINETGEGAKLRKELSNRCWALGISVLAEHNEIEAAGKKIFATAKNLARWEILVAIKSRLVIIIPDSPGSFAELGAFAQHKDICPRMVILFDKKYETDDSYIQRGPRRAAEERHATVIFDKYSEVETIWQKVSKLILMEKARMAEE